MARFKFTVESGLLFRNGMRREIEQYAWDAKLTLNLKEDKGWFDSVFYCTFEGTDKQIIQAQKDLTAWAKSIESGDTLAAID